MLDKDGRLVTPAAQQRWHECAHRADCASAAEHERDCEPCQDEPTWSEEPA